MKPSNLLNRLRRALPDRRPRAPATSVFADTMMARPGKRSLASPMKVRLEPRMWRVCGVWPNGRTWTNGSFA